MKDQVRPCSPPDPGSGRQQFSIYFTRAQLAAIRRTAAELRISASELLRRVWDEWQEQQKGS